MDNNIYYGSYVTIWNNQFGNIRFVIVHWFSVCRGCRLSMCWKCSTHMLLSTSMKFKLHGHRRSKKRCHQYGMRRWVQRCTVEKTSTLLSSTTLRFRQMNLLLIAKYLLKILWARKLRTSGYCNAGILIYPENYQVSLMFIDFVHDSQ